MTLSLSVSFEGLLNIFSDCFTKSSFENFKTLITGWVLTPGRKTITRVIQSADAVNKKHHSCFYNFFSRAKWNIDLLSKLVAKMIVKVFIPTGNPIVTAGDDTLYAKSGHKIPGTGMFRDPVLSTKNITVLRWGQNWVTLGIILKLPFFNERYICLPIMARYCSKKQPYSTKEDIHQTRCQLMVEMLCLFASWFPEYKSIHVVDGAYANNTVVPDLPKNVEIVSRIRKDAAIFTSPPKPTGKRGAPRKKGDRLPTPEQIANHPSIPFKEIEATVYGETRIFMVKGIKALWYRVAKDRLLYILIVRDPLGKYNDEFYFTTDFSLLPWDVLELIAGRWSIEVTHRDSKQYLGINDPQIRNPKSVKREIPFGFLIMSLIILWYAKYGYKSCYDIRPKAPWYNQKQTPSFLDMLATLRRSLWASAFFDNSTSEVKMQKISGGFDPVFAPFNQNKELDTDKKVLNPLKFIIQIASMAA
ncbi:MAG: transposase [bacterium]